MAVTAEQMIILLEASGSKQAAAEIRAVGKAVDETANKVEDAGEKTKKTQESFVHLAFEARALVSTFQSVAQGLILFTGINVASRFERLEIGFTNILGSGRQARALLEDLRGIGATTEFNTENLVEYARLLLATGSNARNVTKEVRALTDAVSFVGLDTETVGRLALNLSQIRNSPRPNRVDLKQFAYAGINLDKIFAAGTGQNIAAGGGMAALQAMTGPQAFDTIVRGMEKAFGGTAQKNAASMLGIIQNIGEVFGTVMLPTGRILLAVLKPIGSFVQHVGAALGTVNAMTGGLAGLFLVFRMGANNFNLLKGAFILARTEVDKMRTSLLELAGAASAGKAAGAGAGAAGISAGTALAGGAAAGGAVGLGGRLLGGVKGIFGKLKGGVGAIIGGIGLDLLGNAIGGTVGKYLSNIGVYGGIGAGIGSFFPGYGTAIGAGIGAAFGVGKTLYDQFTGGGAGASSAETAAEKLDTTNELLDDIKSKISGGGERARSIVSEIELEYTLAKWWYKSATT